MKKDKCLISFIIVIFISVIVKIVSDYEAWPIIVSAVTWGSFFFALADCLLTDERETELYVSYCEDTLLGIDKLEEQVQKKIKKANESPDFVSLSSSYNQIETDLNRVKKGTKKMRFRMRIRSFFKSASGIFRYLAFISFFLILMFQGIAEYTVKFQDLVTVIAFGAILIAQLWKKSNEELEEIEIEKKKSSKLLQEISETLSQKEPLV